MVNDEQIVIDDAPAAPTPPPEPTPEEIARVEALVTELSDVQTQIDRLNDHLAGAPNNEQYKQELLHYEGVKTRLKADLGVE